MPITVGDHTYIVGKASKSAACIQHPVLKTWQIFKRHAGESDAMMQKRVIDYFDQLGEGFTLRWFHTQGQCHLYLFTVCHRFFVFGLRSGPVDRSFVNLE